MSACTSPFIKKDEVMPLPCGKCPACNARRISSWSFRLMQEEKQSKSAHFITFTYANENLKTTPKNFKTLEKRDLQLFFKRLRKASPPFPKIKYYAVGEYGTHTMRPHYHAIVFNADVDIIDNTWSLGYIYAGTVTEASIGYTLKYINKKGKIPLHQNDDRVKEFSLMSKGLGLSYLSPAMTKWHLSAPVERVYCNLLSGQKIAMPRYYKNKLYNVSQLSEYADHVRELSNIKTLEEMEKNPRYFADKGNAHQASIDKANFIINLTQNNKI